MTDIINPIITGCSPDPAICRAGDDYYIATSTFVWCPGVSIYHSRDLINWSLAASPIDRHELADFRGEEITGGIWAPCLTWHDGLFHLVYTNARSRRYFRDYHNYLITAKSIEGPWSEPIHLLSGGHDPSLFHDSDGRKWYTMLEHDCRPGRGGIFSGISLQEYSAEKKSLIGPIRKIFDGTWLGATEAPHIYRHQDWYYLMVAEGGTFFTHCVTIARSRDIWGPYDIDPEGPILHSWGQKPVRDEPYVFNPEVPLQKSGHASLVETPDGEVYLAHLCSRPLIDHRGPRCILGRETALQKAHWTDDGWLRLADGGFSPSLKVPAPKTQKTSPVIEDTDLDFTTCKKLPLEIKSLRTPVDDSWIRFDHKPNHLTMVARESISSPFETSLIGVPCRHLQASLSTIIEFTPIDYRQMAGITAFYNEFHYYYLCLSHDENDGPCLKICACDKDKYSEFAQTPIPTTRCRLRVTLDHHHLFFEYATDANAWQRIGPKLDATILSDDYVRGFTGTFFAICAQDLGGRRPSAHFSTFSYRSLNHG